MTRAGVMRGLWMLVPEPRMLRFALAACYVWVIITGLQALLNPPSTLGNVLGGWLTAAMITLYLVGGTLCLVSVLRGAMWIERVGIVLLAGGGIARLSSVIGLALSSEGSFQLPIAEHARFLFFLVVAFILSSPYDHDPDLDARRIEKRRRREAGGGDVGGTH